MFAAEHFVGGLFGLGLAIVQAGADRGEQVLARLADVGVGVEQAALEDIGAVTQHTGALAHLGAALDFALLALLTLFGNVVLELCLQLTQLAHLRAELEGAADGENGVHEVNAEDE